VENGDFLHDTVDIISQLDLIENLDCNLKVFVMLVRREENAAECTDTKDLSLRIDVIILLELMDTLLFIALA